MSENNITACRGFAHMDINLQRKEKLLSDLSQRELDVLKLIAKGMSNDQIASTLFISPHTVKNHVSNVYRKMGMDDRTQVAITALRLGLVPLEKL